MQKSDKIKELEYSIASLKETIALTNRDIIKNNTKWDYVRVKKVKSHLQILNNDLTKLENKLRKERIKLGMK